MDTVIHNSPLCCRKRAKVAHFNTVRIVTIFFCTALPACCPMTSEFSKHIFVVVFVNQMVTPLSTTCFTNLSKRQPFWQTVFCDCNHCSLFLSIIICTFCFGCYCWYSVRSNATRQSATLLYSYSCHWSRRIPNKRMSRWYVWCITIWIHSTCRKLNGGGCRIFSCILKNLM